MYSASTGRVSCSQGDPAAVCPRRLGERHRRVAPRPFLPSRIPPAAPVGTAGRQRPPVCGGAGRPVAETTGGDGQTQVPHRLLPTTTATTTAGPCDEGGAAAGRRGPSSQIQ